MLRTVLSCIGVVLAGAGLLQAASQESSSPAPSSHRALVNRYCVVCHNEKLRTAELLLDKADVEIVSQDAAVWEKVVTKLQAGQMPPSGMPRPDQTTLDSFSAYLKTELDRAAAANPNPGRPPAHRLNRAEYANAIRDLLAVEIDTVSLLPADNADYGFDNIADVLSVSPLLMERYMLAAGKVSRLAIGDPTIRPASEEYKLPQLLVQEERMSDSLPFGSRGGIAVQHRFPLDGEYVIRIRLQRNNDGYIRGLREPNQLNVRLDGARIKTFTVGGEYPGRTGPVFSRNDPDYRGDTEQVAYEYSADADLEVRFAAKAGTRLVGVAFQKENSKPEGVYMPPLRYGDMGQYRGGNPAVDAVTVTGPYNAKGSGETPSRQKIFVCSPARGEDEEPCAKKILSTLARRAYRRPLSQEDLQTLLSLYQTGRSDGGFEAGIQLALQRILAGPEFLFRIERDPAGVAPGTAYRINDVEMASRLSFFLWSTMPDEELLGLAESGRLKDPTVLQQQVQRMLADSRSKTLVSNFAGQWLSLRNMRLVAPDTRVFPDFDDNLRNAFQQEAELFFESMLREDRSVLDLLDADHTFVNERLARHYGIPNVYGSHFRRVTLEDEARKGLLGKGTILTVTSRVNRTSPVLRGKWVLENLLGTPPPPPPPDVVGTLEEEDEEGKALTMREQMDQHSANPACESCHSLMDPIGFAMENFDAIGRWRTTSPFGDTNPPIDAAGVLPDGTQIEGVVEFRQVLLNRPEQFLTSAAGKLLTYALGRGTEYYDAPVVRKILREAAPNGYRWSDLISGIVRSTPFQMRRSREP